LLVAVLVVNDMAGAVVLVDLGPVFN